MKMILRFIIPLLYIQMSFANGQFNIKDRILTFNFLEAHKHLIFSHKKYELDEVFLRGINTLEDEKRISVLKSIQSLEKILPKTLVKPLIHWTYIKTDKDNLQKVLSFIMIYKALLIRDYIDDPSTNKNEDKRTSLFLQDFYNDKSLTSNNISEKFFNKFKKIALNISKEPSIEAIIKKISDHPYLKTDLSSSLINSKTYIVNNFGYIPGNTIKKIRQETINLKSLIASSKKSLFIHLRTLKSLIPVDKISNFTQLIKTREKELGHRIDIFIILDQSLKKVDENYNLTKFKILESLRIQLQVKIISKKQTRYPAQFQKSPQNFSITQTQHKDMVIIDGQTAYIQLDKEYTTVTKGPLISLYQYAYLSKYQTSEIPDELEIDKDAQTTRLIFNESKLSHFFKNEMAVAVIDMIKYSMNSIFISTNALNNPVIINALIKRKIINPNIKINILVKKNKTENGNEELIFFLKKLKSKNIQVRVLHAQTKELQEVISIDGKNILYFSNHPGIINFQGFDIKTIAEYDTYFQTMFLNKKLTKKLNIEGFRFKIEDHQNLNKHDTHIGIAIGSSILNNKKELLGL